MKSKVEDGLSLTFGPTLSDFLSLFNFRRLPIRKRTVWGLFYLKSDSNFFTDRSSAVRLWFILIVIVRPHSVCLQADVLFALLAIRWTRAFLLGFRLCRP